MANNNTNSPNIRPPVVVVLGHVDHGKTKLLDTIRKTNIAEKESGGITQRIGAYQVSVGGPSTDSTGSLQASSGSKTITFLDTPGHEAFTAIRSRGAKIADIAVLVVAADESVKPQTKEAIKTIKGENIPFVVAINKIDKEAANIPKVKQDLAAEDVLVEDWGGNVPVVEISAKEGKNIPGLLEIILLLAELEDLKEDTTLPAEGVIIESSLNKGRGYVATILIEKGILKLGDWIVAGISIGKVKSLHDFIGKPISEARPSQPVEVTGWQDAPEIGRRFIAAYSKDEAMKLKADNVDLSPLLQFFKGLVDENQKGKVLNFIFKSDVPSSLEALDNILKGITSEEVGYKVVTYGIGAITEGDIKTAIATKSQVVGFRVNTEDSAKRLAERESVKITNFDVIYELVEYIRLQMGALLEPEVKRTLLGKLKILALFKKDGKSHIVGGKVISGKIVRGVVTDIIRGANKITTAKISQLQHNKEDVTEVKEGLEAGLKLDLASKEPVELKEGDTLECYDEEIIPRTL